VYMDASKNLTRYIISISYFFIFVTKLWTDYLNLHTNIIIDISIRYILFLLMHYTMNIIYNTKPANPILGFHILCNPLTLHYLSY